MHQVVLTLPSTIKDDEAQLYLAMELFETGKLCLGQAAKLAGYSKRAFMEILGKHQVPVFDYSADDLKRDVEKA